MSPKKKVSRTATKKKTTAKKKPAVKKKPAATKEKTAVKKASPAKKKTTAKKKQAAAPKPAPKKKAAVKKAAPKKKTEVKKTVKNTKAVTAPKKTAPAKASTVAKRKIAPKKPRSAEAKARAELLLQEFGNFEPYKLKKGEEYMNDDQIDHFRNILSAWKHALMEEVDRTVHYMQDEAANFPDPNDRASQESDFTMELRARDRERRLIKKIEESINGLDGDEYGFCDSCGVEIGIRRLEARPTASLCIDCKTLDEIREKQSGGR